jgi:hypothetical protein
VNDTEPILPEDNDDEFAIQHEYQAPLAAQQPAAGLFLKRGAPQRVPLTDTNTLEIIDNNDNTNNNQVLMDQQHTSDIEIYVEEDFDNNGFPIGNDNTTNHSNVQDESSVGKFYR